MDEIKKEINPNFMPIFTQKIESKSTAIQYAIDTTVTFDEDGNKKINFDKAKELFDFICQNVDLPDVPKGLFDNMDVNIEKLKEQIREKLSVDANKTEAKDDANNHFDGRIDEENKQECSCTSCTCEPKDVTERIKTFEDACRELGEYNKLVNEYRYVESTNISKDLAAYLKLRIISAALNEGLEPTFKNNENRYYPYLILYTKEEVENMDEDTKKNLGLFGGSASHGARCGFVAADAYLDFGDALANRGSRLALKTRELAIYCGRQFIDLWYDLYVGK